MIDSKRLLADLQKQVTLLEADLVEQLTALPGAAALLRGEYDAERTARRTAAEWPDWRDAQLTQIAVAWVLGTVFLRWSEDNGLIEPVLSGPGHRLAVAEDAQLAHYRRHPEHNDGDWLAEQFEVLRNTDAGRLLFDEQHNPMYWVPISHDAAKALVAFWRSTDANGLRHDFTDPDWDTRFLGDLYQDLSEDAKKRYALLQTPRFVERFILDRTLTPAIDEFGLDGLRLIDPACGSGHFLLGAFERLVAAWREQTPTLDDYELAHRALGSVHGVDTNPFAVAIARFRLLVEALKTAGVRTLAKASRQSWRPIVGCTDSLRTPERQESFAEVDEAIGYRARWEDIEDFADERLLASANYHAVVGNPPYITVKDAEQNEYYRKRWSACHRQFQLTVPFAQRIFDLACRAGDDCLGAGYTGQITSNAFMKREFGTKLIKDFFPSVELNYVVDTSGAYIPGHGTPTVILIGRRVARSRRDAVRAVLGVRGEPEQPADPEKGLVWTAIEAHVEHPGSESDWVSVVDLPRSRLASHPWSLSGGGAGDVAAALESTASSRLAERIDLTGRTTHTGLDDAYYMPRGSARRLGFPNQAVPVVLGDEVRDYRIEFETETAFPYDRHGVPRDLTGALARQMWRVRTPLIERVDFGQKPYERGLRWFDHSMFFPRRFREPLSIAFAFVATHNHFVLDRGGKVFKQSAPVIKLPEGASEADHLALLGVLNSSTACFWLKQVCHDKGNRGEGGGITSSGWERFYEFTGTKLEQFPLPADLPLAAGTHLDSLAQQLAATTAAATAEVAPPTRERLAVARAEYDRLRAEMISAQEDLDWDVYRRYGLLSDAEAAEVVWEGGSAEPLNLGERAFEIVLARKVAAGQAETQWFARHGSTPITEPPAHWPDAYRRTVEARIELIEKRRDLALIERPECKRRWSTESWEKQQERALRTWLLDRLEARDLWFATDMNGQEQPAPQTVRSLADQVRGNGDFVAVASLWAGDALGRPDAELAEVVGALIDDEHVPFLAAYRYKPAGLARRALWERTWSLHSSLSASERRRSEQAFAEARDCVIVATSTLELGIDIGDLDRVIQIGAPRTVASFLQRLGRTGRRPGSTRNCLFLTLDQDQTVQAAGLLATWAQGWVEPVVPPFAPRHVVAQQLLALALQENTVGLKTWPEWWHGIAPMAADGAEILNYLVDEGFLDTDGGLAFIGPAAERQFGRRHFMELMAVFTAAPEFTVFAGREEIGSVGDDALLADTVGAPRVLLLAGRAWLVTHVDWKRRRCYVEATDLPGQAKWGGQPGGLSFEITRGMRGVLLGTDPPGVGLSKRATAMLGELRQHHASHVDENGTVLRRSSDGDVHWWTWAGTAANRTLHASLDIVDPRQRLGDRVLRLRQGTDLREAAAELRGSKVAELVDPAVNPFALRGLKFSAALSEAMATATIARRLGDKTGSATVLREARVLATET